MSLFEEYEEIEFSDDSTIELPETKKPKKTSHSKDSPFGNIKANPYTYDLDCLIKQVPSKFLKKVSSDKQFSTPKKNTNEVVERLYFKKQLSENRLRFKRQEQELEIKKECTFSPKISRPSPKRPFKDFIQGQKNFELRKKSSLEKLRINKKREEENTRHLKLELSPRSKKLLSRRKGSKDINLRLNANTSFKPDSEMSSQLSTSQNVSDRLYYDAKLRARKACSPGKPPLHNFK